ncbi:hypothetical protein ACT4XR_20190 (plasmid) [Acinetobacter baumannii]|uniref:hypothetical protein n=1 Tax=Acinetobacter baumannii TaxID=470 RepID=UPI0038926C67
MKKNVLITLILLSANTFASDWINVTGDTQKKYFVDRESVKNSPSYGSHTAQAWVKVLHKNHYNLVLTIVDCENNLMGIKSATTYKNDEAAPTRVSNDQFDMDEVIPDTTGEATLKQICQIYKQIAPVTQDKIKNPIIIPADPYSRLKISLQRSEHLQNRIMDEPLK